jgi:hypothetical protein
MCSYGFRKQISQEASRGLEIFVLKYVALYSSMGQDWASVDIGGDLIQELGLSISISQLTAQPGAGLCILITVVLDVPLFG